MRKFALLLVFCYLACTSCKRDATIQAPIPNGPAAATKAQGRAPKLPAPVKSLIASYADECKQIGGTLTGGVTIPEIETIDLDADGKADYILNPKNLQCSESASLFCPNAGCDIRIAVSGNHYQNVFSVLGGEPTVADTSQGRTVEIPVQSFNCKGANRTDTCIDSIEWTNNRISQKFRVKP